MKNRMVVHNEEEDKRRFLAWGQGGLVSVILSYCTLFVGARVLESLEGCIELSQSWEYGIELHLLLVRHINARNYQTMKL